MQLIHLLHHGLAQHLGRQNLGGQIENEFGFAVLPMQTREHLALQVDQRGLHHLWVGHGLQHARLNRRVVLEHHQIRNGRHQAIGQTGGR